MPNLDERFRIIEEMLGLFMQNVNEQRVKGYRRHLKDIPTDRLRAACAGCIEHGSQRGAPTVAEIRRRAAETACRSSHLGEPVQEIKERPEHAGTVARLRDWNYTERVITDVLGGEMPCPTGPKVFSEKGLRLLKRGVERHGMVFHHVDFSQLGDAPGRGVTIPFTRLDEEMEEIL